MNNNRIEVLTPEGQSGTVPQNQLQAALKEGFTLNKNAANPVASPGSPNPTANVQNFGQKLLSDSASALSYPASVMSGSMQGLRNIENLPVRAFDSITGKNYNLAQPESVNTMLNLPQNPRLQAMSTYLPAAALPEVGGLADATGIAANIGKQAFSGGLYGAAQSKKGVLPFQAMISAGLNSLIGGGSNIVGGAAKMLAKNMASNTLPVFSSAMNRMAQYMKNNIPSQSGATLLNNAYTNAKQLANWHNITNHASAIDTAIPDADKNTFFDTSGYLNDLNSIKGDFANKARNNKGYVPLINEINDRIDNPPHSFQDAIAQRSAINEIPQNWDKTTNNLLVSRSRNLSQQMGSALDKQVMQNSSTVPNSQDFYNNWTNIRNNYGKMKNFQSLPVGNKAGGLSLQYNKNLASDMQNNDTLPDQIMNHFMPKQGKGTLNMIHYSNLIGDDKAGQQIIRDNYLQPAWKSGEFDPKKAIGLYNKLAPDQKDYLFNPTEQSSFIQYNKAKTIAEKQTSANFIKNFLLHRGGLAATGLVGGGLYGESQGEGFSKPALTGAVVGGMLPTLFQAGAPAFASEKGLNMLSKMANKGLNLRKLAVPLEAAINPPMQGHT